MNQVAHTNTNPQRPAVWLFSSPELRSFWPAPRIENSCRVSLRCSRPTRCRNSKLETTDFRLSAQPQKFETKTVTIGYKNGQLLRLRAILARALDLWSWPKGSQLDLGTRMPYGRYLTHAHSHITPAVKFLFFVIFGPFFCPKRVMVSGPQWHYLGQVPPPPLSPILRGAR